MAKKPKLTEKEKVEFIKIQRDRLNVLVQGLAPATLQLLMSDVGQSLLWWQLSRRNELLGIVNKAMLTTEFLDLIPTVDTVEFPKPIIAGAFIETSEDLIKFGGKGIDLDWGGVPGIGDITGVITGIFGGITDLLGGLDIAKDWGEDKGRFYNRFYPPFGMSRQNSYTERENVIRELYPFEYVDEGETKTMNYIPAKCRDPDTGLFTTQKTNMNYAQFDGKGCPIGEDPYSQYD